MNYRRHMKEYIDTERQILEELNIDEPKRGG